MADNEKGLIEEIKAQAFQVNEDHGERALKLERILATKLKYKAEFWDLVKITGKKETELMQSEEVAAGKNKEIRDAILEGLKLEHEEFDRLDYVKRILAVIRYVEDHNGRFITLLEIAKG